MGGGAAGLFAALRARELAPERPVTVLESSPRTLAKVRISGGGRCNLTHSCFEASRLVENYPRGGRPLRSLLERFGPAETVRWFESRGVALKTEPDGRMFPATDSSETIAACLESEARRLGVRILTRSPVRDVAPESRPGARFRVELESGSLPADRLLLATGGSPKGFAWAAAFGHAVVPGVPSLFTFEIRDPRLEGLQGLSVPRARARVGTVTAEGPLLVTHWGLSGPLVLRLSAWGARELHASGYRAELLLDLLPDLGQEQVRSALLGAKTRTPRRQAANECPFDLPRRLWARLLEAEGVAPDTAWAEVPHKPLNRLSETLKRWRLEIRGKGAFKEEFVTAGGVPLAEVDLRTMESRRQPGLHFAGEILDVDGLTGGFNFQNAWATGWIAGSALGT